jgi:hypothetical protein
MELGTALLNTFVVLAVGTALAYVTNDRFRTLRRDIDQLRDELRGDIRRLDAGLDALRSDLTQVALAVGARDRTAEG